MLEVVSGNGSFTFAYVPSLLALPAGVELVNAHGLVQDPTDGSILLAYQPDNSRDNHCLVRWRPDGTGGVRFGAGSALCAGTPHGLRLAVEDGVPFLYHANNDAALHKTRLDGSLVWSVSGPPGGNASYLPYRLTWFAAPPGSQYVYLADGDGSNFIHVYNRSGGYSGRSFGGRGTAPGLFQTCHAINFDPRRGQLIVSDRENHRHQYFDFTLSAATPSDVTFTPASQFHTDGLDRPCHIQFFRDIGSPKEKSVAEAVPRAEGEGQSSDLKPGAAPFPPAAEDRLGGSSPAWAAEARKGGASEAATRVMGAPRAGGQPWGPAGRVWVAGAGAVLGLAAAGLAGSGAVAARVEARTAAVVAPLPTRGASPASVAAAASFGQEDGPASHAVVASLDGSVGILDASNRLVASVDVGRLLGALGHQHPHDAIVLANGDLAIATWNPGRLSYWRRLGLDRAREVA